MAQDDGGEDDRRKRGRPTPIGPIAPRRDRQGREGAPPDDWPGREPRRRAEDGAEGGPRAPEPERPRIAPPIAPRKPMTPPDASSAHDDGADQGPRPISDAEQAAARLRSLARVSRRGLRAAPLAPRRPKAPVEDAATTVEPQQSQPPSPPQEPQEPQVSLEPQSPPAAKPAEAVGGAVEGAAPRRAAVDEPTAEALRVAAEQEAVRHADREAEKRLLSADREPAAERNPEREAAERAAEAARAKDRAEAIAFAASAGFGPTMIGARATAGKPDLAQVEADLKIKARYLKAIEDVDPDALPDDAYLPGYVRAYARYLQPFLPLTPDEAFEMFRAELAAKRAGAAANPGVKAPAKTGDLSVLGKVRRGDGQRSTAPLDAAAEPAERRRSVAADPASVRAAAQDVARRLAAAKAGGPPPRARPAASGRVAIIDDVEPGFEPAPELTAPRGRGGALGLAAMALIALALLGGALWFFAPSVIGLDRRGELVVVGELDPIAPPPEAARPLAPAESVAPQDLAAATPAPALGFETPALTVVTPEAAPDAPTEPAPEVEVEVEPAAEPAPEAAPSPEAVAAPSGPAFAVVALAETWARIRAADGATLFEGTLAPGRVIALDPTAGPYPMRVGNAGGLALILDGAARGPLGAVGAVATLEASPEAAAALPIIEAATSPPLAAE